MKKYLTPIAALFLYSITLIGCGTNEKVVESPLEEETQSEEMGQNLTEASFEFSWNDIEYHKEENSLSIEFNTNLPDDTIVNLAISVTQPDDWGEEYRDFFEYRWRLGQSDVETIVNDGLITYTFTNDDFRGDLLPNAIYSVLISVPVYEDVNAYIKEQYNNRDDFEDAFLNLGHDFWIFDHDLDHYNDYKLNFHLSEEVHDANSLADIIHYYEANTVPFKDVEKNPAKYAGVHATYTGEVLEIHEKKDEEELARTNSLFRLAINGDPDNVIFVGHQTTKGMEDVYAGDEITIYGNLLGPFTYESTSGHQITIPAMDAIIYVK